MLACKFVAGLDIEYGKKGSRKATLSVWRTYVVNTADGNELRVVQEVADDVCPVLFLLYSDILHMCSAATKETLPII